jgi:hypothetical protein
MTRLGSNSRVCSTGPPGDIPTPSRANAGRTASSLNVSECCLLSQTSTNSKPPSAARATCKTKPSGSNVPKLLFHLHPQGVIGLDRCRDPGHHSVRHGAPPLNNEWSTHQTLFSAAVQRSQPEIALGVGPQKRPNSDHMTGRDDLSPRPVGLGPTALRPSRGPCPVVAVVPWSKEVTAPLPQEDMS